MTKVRLNLNTKGITRRVKLEIGRALKNSKVDELLKDELVRTIQEEERLANGKKVKALKPSTIQQRKRLAKTNSTDPNYSAGKSNLTFTGDLLRKGIKSSFITSKLLVRLFPKKGKHIAYKYKKKKGKRVDYEKIFQGQADQGRNVFDISQKFLDNITKIVRKELKRFLS